MTDKEKALKNLGLTDEEIADVIETDKRIDKGEKLFELDKELEKGAKKGEVCRKLQRIHKSQQREKS